MTFSVWWAKVQRFLSGREGADRHAPVSPVTPIELPEIDPPGRSLTADGRDAEKVHLERKKREHDMELARLRAIALGRAQRRDA